MRNFYPSQPSNYEIISFIRPYKLHYLVILICIDLADYQSILSKQPNHASWAKHSQ